MANEDPYNSTSTDNFKYQYSAGGSVQGSCAVGQYGALGIIKGVIRFPNIPIAQGTTVNYAVLYFYIEARSDSGGNLKCKVYGIDEDNTAILTGDPFGRPETTAVTTLDDTVGGVGTYEDFGVTAQVNEILARGGWASGNAMGFHVKDNGTGDGSYIEDDHTGNTYLLIRVSAEPNFFPTPGSISAPTFPAASSQGLKISIPGVDVRNATESQLLLTTRKKELKIITESSQSVTSGVEKLIAHGLATPPAHLAYVESGGYRFKLNRDLLGATDPITGGAQGYIGADSTNVRIIIDQTKNVYYYIFIDPLSE